LIWYVLQDERNRSDQRQKIRSYDLADESDSPPERVVHHLVIWFSYGSSFRTIAEPVPIYQIWIVTMPRTGGASIEYKPDYSPIPENLRKIREPIVLNATDAALISDMLRRIVMPLSERDWMLRVLREGSKNFRI
jgi:hypothetical protein